MGVADFIFNVAMDTSDVQRKFAGTQKLAKETGKVMERALTSGFRGIAGAAFSPVTNTLNGLASSALSMYQNSFGGRVQESAGAAFGPGGAGAVEGVRKGIDAYNSAATAQTQTMDFAATLGRNGIGMSKAGYASIEEMLAARNRGIAGEIRKAQDAEPETAGTRAWADEFGSSKSENEDVAQKRFETGVTMYVNKAMRDFGQISLWR